MNSHGGRTLAKKKKEIRLRLLQKTISTVKNNIPAYSMTLRNIKIPARLEDLGSLPLLSRGELVEDGNNSFRDSLLGTALIQHTKGTTGKPLYIHRSHQELAFLLNFFMMIGNSGPKGPTCIRISSLKAHGQPTPLPHSGNVLAIEPLQIEAKQDLEEIIEEIHSQCEGQPTPFVVALERDLRLFTNLAMEHDLDLRALRVHALFVTGTLITSFRKAFYEDVWGAPLTDRYSMAELGAGATACQLCGDWHPDPSLIAEGLDPISGQVVEEGPAELVFTTLFPFVQKQPLIRYLSGDLALIRRNRCSFDDFGFVPQGRLKSAIFDPDCHRANPWLVGIQSLSALEEHPDVLITRFRKDGLTTASHGAEIGDPIARFESHGGRILEIKVRVRYREACQDIIRASEELREALLVRQPLLLSAVREGRAALVVESDTDSFPIQAYEPYCI